MNIAETMMFVAYFLAMLGIGIYFFIKTRGGGEKDYFLGGRKMSGVVAALSAGASDMSSWVLMGLPASIFVAGIGKVWIAIGLAIGTILSWFLIAPRLRRFSIVAGDSITLPQYLTNRFLSSSKLLQIICAVIFLVVYAIYAASSIKACGTLFNAVMGVDTTLAMYIAAGIIVLYTFLGGFFAVCWTDFFQGTLMLLALMTAPIAALTSFDATSAAAALPASFFSLLPGDGFGWESISGILTGLGWGLGYFGMPHIIIRYMSIKSPAEVARSRKIGSLWTCLILVFAVAVAIIGRMMLGELDDPSTVFIKMVRSLFPSVISGILLSAILAAAMSTADSQLLASASAFVSDVYKPVFRKNASDKEMLWVGRGVVALVSIAALIIASSPDSGSIMELVENAWGLFGAAFGPVIILSLFWRDFTFGGAVAGIVAGALVDVLWLALFAETGLYEIIPGFAAGMLAAFAVSKLGRASAKTQALFDSACAYKD